MAIEPEVQHRRTTPTTVPRGQLQQCAGTVRLVDLVELQRSIALTYGARDSDRGVPATVAWLAEEVGELARAVRKGTTAEQEHEFADVLAWLATLANQLGIDLASAVDRYAAGCPRCGDSPCACLDAHWSP